MMTEKSFAATPLTCHEEIFEVKKIMKETFENCIMAFDKISLKSKDFEDIHVPVYKNQLHFLGKCFHSSFSASVPQPSPLKGEGTIFISLRFHKKLGRTNK